jgi:hypothetical protein
MFIFGSLKTRECFGIAAFEMANKISDCKQSQNLSFQDLFKIAQEILRMLKLRKITTS